MRPKKYDTNELIDMIAEIGLQETITQTGIHRSHLYRLLIAFDTEVTPIVLKKIILYKLSKFTLESNTVSELKKSADILAILDKINTETDYNKTVLLIDKEDIILE